MKSREEMSVEMIQATFKRLDNNQIISFELSGHAESGPYGKDIVCAAVSALSIGTVNSLIELGHVDPVIRMQEEKGGYLSVVLPKELSKERQHDAQLLLESLFLSLKSVQEEYAEYINFNERKINDE